MMRRLSWGIVGCLVATACGSATKTPPATPPTEPPITSTSPDHPSVQPEVHAPSARDVYARLETDLVACYQAGAKKIPTMRDGKVTLHTGVDTSGRSTCVVTSEDTGLTQEVEDCMSSRLAKEVFPSGPGEWTVELPVVVKAGKLSLDETDDDPAGAEAFDEIETHDIPGALSVIEGLMPDFRRCVQGMEKRKGIKVLHVGAHVGKDGAVSCALATSNVDLPDDVRKCAAGVVSRAKFSPPKSGSGLVSIPLRIIQRRQTTAN